MTNDNLIEEFIAECNEHFEALDKDLLEMEQAGADIDKEVINRVFRAMHSIKGSAGFFGFESIKTLSHTMENILNLFRDGKSVPDGQKVDALFAGLDKLREMTQNIETSNDIPFEEELKVLNEILSPSETTIEQAQEKETVKQERETPSETEKTPLVETAPESQPDNFESRCVIHLQVLDEKMLMIDQSQDKENLTPSVLKESLLAIHGINTIAKENNVLAISELTAKIETIFLKIQSGSLKANHSIIDVIGGSIEKIRELSKSPQSISEDAYKYDLDMLSDIIQVYQEIDAEIEIETETKPETKNKAEAPTPLETPLETPSTQALEEQQTEKPEKLKEDSSKPKQETEKEITKEKKTPKKEKAIEKIAPHEMIRISVDLIDRLMNYAGELVLSRNRLRQVVDIFSKENPELNPVLQNLDFVTSEIQAHIMQMRMQPVGNVLNKFPRIVRDLSKNLGKKVDLKIEGNEIELDKSIIEGLSEPLTHIIRNCMDHGIELPDEREKNNKSRTGIIELRVFHEGGQVNISIKDNGKGIDPNAVIKSAMSKGIISKEEAKKMSDGEKLNLIFLPGLSTAESLSDISGRGVGMDVVKTNIEKLGGHLELNSTIGLGTSVSIRVPLTLAIVPSLIIGTCNYRFAIPQSNLKELVCVPADKIHEKVEKIGGIYVVRLREDILPLINLAEVLRLPGYEESLIENKINSAISSKNITDINKNSELPEEKDIPTLDNVLESNLEEKKHISDLNIVCLQMGSNSYGLIVDELFDNEEIVVKPLSRYIQEIKSFSGATIMGDSKVITILDTAGIAQTAQLRFGEVREESKKRKEELLKTQALGKEKQSILIFSNGNNEFFALPLSSISRLEKVETSNLEHFGDRKFIQYRGEGLPLIHLERYLPVTPFNVSETNNFYVIIPKTEGFLAGIIASEILDTMEVSVELHEDSTSQPGAIGSAVVNDQLTIFLNSQELVNMLDIELETKH
jgi:two-component system, chemotaxis family, sensor kinase CheA